MKPDWAEDQLSAYRRATLFPESSSRCSQVCYKIFHLDKVTARGKDLTSAWWAPSPSPVAIENSKTGMISTIFSQFGAITLSLALLVLAGAKATTGLRVAVVRLHTTL